MFQLKKYILPIVIFILVFVGVFGIFKFSEEFSLIAKETGLVFGGPTVTFHRSMLPITDATYDLGSTTPALEWKNLFVGNIAVSSSTATSTFAGNIDVTGDNNADGQRCFDDTDCISAWTDIAADDAIAEVPSGTIDGVNTSFTLSEVPTDDDNVVISVNGQVQRNGTDVTIAGTAVTFTLAPETGWTIFAHYNKTSSVFSPGLNNTIVTKTTDYTVTNNDGTILMDNSSLATTTLPTAVGVAGQMYVIKKISAAGSNVIIDADGTETIDGGLTATLTLEDESISIVSDNANWHIF